MGEYQSCGLNLLPDEFIHGICEEGSYSSLKNNEKRAYFYLTLFYSGLPTSEKKNIPKSEVDDSVALGLEHVF